MLLGNGLILLVVLCTLLSFSFTALGAIPGCSSTVQQECGAGVGHVFQQLTQLLTEVDIFDEGALLQACRKIQRRTQCTADYHARCNPASDNGQYFRDVLMVQVCDVPDLQSKVLSYAVCYKLVDSEEMEACDLKVTQRVLKMVRHLTNLFGESGNETNESVKLDLCCMYDALLTCHQPILAKKCEKVADMFGQMFSRILAINDCPSTSELNCSRTDEDENVTQPDADPYNTFLETPVSALEVDQTVDHCGTGALIRCVNSGKEIMAFGLDMATRVLQGKTDKNKEKTPPLLTNTQTRNVCKKIQQTVRCFTDYYKNCMTFNIPLLTRMVNNIPKLLDICDRPDLHETIRLLTSCGVTEDDLAVCTGHTQKLQQAITVLQTQPAVIKDLMGQNFDMKGLLMITCCMMEEVEACYEPIYTQKCTKDEAMVLLNAIKIVDILVECPGTTACPENMLIYLQSLLHEDSADSFDAERDRAKYYAEL